jgi:hypothetical protein
MPEENLDIRVTPSLHESAISQLEGYSEETAPYLSPVKEVFSDAYITIGKLHTAREQASKNQAWTEDQRILLISKEADKQQERLCKKFDQIHATLTKQADFLNQQLTQPLKEKAGVGSLNSEVRNHAKALTHESRVKLVEDAFEANDTDTLHALLGAQHFLSGLMPEEHAFYTRQLHERQNPAIVQRLTVTRGALKIVQDRAPLLFGQVEKAIGAPRHRVQSIAQRNSAALKALNFDA